MAYSCPCWPDGTYLPYAPFNTTEARQAALNTIFNLTDLPLSDLLTCSSDTLAVEHDFLSESVRFVFFLIQIQRIQV